MKIRSTITAGSEIDACANELAWWQNQTRLMQQYVNSPSNVPPAGLWFPSGGVATQLPEYPSGVVTQLPENPAYANKDMSGFCR